MRPLTEEILDLTYELRQARAQQGNTLEPLRPEDLYQGAKLQKRHTGKGTDKLGPGDVLDLPNCAKEELCGILMLCEEAWTWPWQLLLNLCHLARKPGPVAADRAIAAAAYLVRRWGVARRDVTEEWCEAKAQWWDDAAKGQLRPPHRAGQVHEGRGCCFPEPHQHWRLPGHGGLL